MPHRASGEPSRNATRRTGQSLVLVARREARLKDLAASLSARYGSAIDVIPADLSTADGAAKLAGALATRQIEVGTLINNAGVGDHGDVVTGNPSFPRRTDHPQRQQA
ncbi:SDR family NAD(P)-dependent oxidoreductase [Nocardioides convexus]|uniref:SDR family NAD(P)-dependent oxidoreductase n=1 Tax=Nocardioides convexus TaxID=2712224 RepID=UPI00241883BB|nr:SDR family NAD(P)-dependent oxidoreductase [Nocardioides convexus]